MRGFHGIDMGSASGRLVSGVSARAGSPEDSFYVERPVFSVALLPARPYEVAFVADRHVLGFTLAPQVGVDAFGSDRRRPFCADPWRLAFTPAGCDVFSASERGGEYLALAVDRDAFSRYQAARLERFTNVIEPAFTPLAFMLRRALLARHRSDLEIDELGWAAIVLTAQRLGATRASSSSRLPPRRLRVVLDYLDTRLDQTVRLTDIALEVGLSAAYLARAFKATTGTTIHTALMERRIARARFLISQAHSRSGDLSAIAAESGFASHAHMTTSFRRVLGVTPSQWRTAL